MNNLEVQDKNNLKAVASWILKIHLHVRFCIATLNWFWSPCLIKHIKCIAEFDTFLAIKAKMHFKIAHDYAPLETISSMDKGLFAPKSDFALDLQVYNANNIFLYSKMD